MLTSKCINYITKTLFSTIHFPFVKKNQVSVFEIGVFVLKHIHVYSYKAYSVWYISPK